MKKNKNKKVLFLGLGVMIIVALILVLIFVSSDKENNTSQQGSVNLNNLEDIYAKISDFDRILEKQGITQEQKENAIKNTRTFLNLCEQSYINHNNELPEWNEEEKNKYANYLEVYGVSFEDAYEEADAMPRHWNYIDFTNEERRTNEGRRIYEEGRIYYIGSYNDSFNYQVSCSDTVPFVRANFSTFRYDGLVAYAYEDFGESSIYDFWEDEVNLSDKRYIQYIAP